MSQIHHRTLECIFDEQDIFVPRIFSFASMQTGLYRAFIKAFCVCVQMPFTLFHSNYSLPESVLVPKFPERGVSVSSKQVRHAKAEAMLHLLRAEKAGLEMAGS
jgi:hypothetical protein